MAEAATAGWEKLAVGRGGMVWGIAGLLQNAHMRYVGAQVVCRPAARGVAGEWAHTSGEPCREGGASALVTEAGKVMSYPSGGSDRAAESRCGSWFLSRTRDKAAGFCR